MKKIASDIKLVFYSSTITMMHGQINIKFYDSLKPDYKKRGFLFKSSTEVIIFTYRIS